MYDRDVQRRALALIEQGFTLRSISMSTSVSRSTLRDWRDHPEKQHRRAVCPRCDPVHRGLPEPTREYTYLLGLYLGDGYISPIGDRSKGVWMLRIMCADAWPGLQEECKNSLRAVRPGKKYPRSNAMDAPTYSPGRSTGPVCSPSMVPARNTSAR